MPGLYVRGVGRCVPARMAPERSRPLPYKLPITGGPHFTASLRPHLHRGILPASRQIRAQIDQRIPAGGHAAAVNVPVRHQNAAIVGQGYREIPVPGGIGPGLLIGDLVPRAVVDAVERQGVLPRHSTTSLSRPSCKTARSRCTPRSWRRRCIPPARCPRCGHS